MATKRPVTFAHQDGEPLHCAVCLYQHIAEAHQISTEQVQRHTNVHVKVVVRRSHLTIAKVETGGEQ